MQLNIKDRLVLQGLIMSFKGGRIDTLALKEITILIEVTTSDIEKYDIKESGNGLVWPNNEATAIEIELNRKQNESLINLAHFVDDNKAYTLDNATILERILTELR